MFKFLLATSFLLFMSCGSDETQMNSDDPDNLVVEVEFFDGQPGYVEITATANNAVEYQFDLGESRTAPKTNTSGFLTHTYQEIGNYELEVKAFGTSGRFLREKKLVPFGESNTSETIDDRGYTTPTSYDGMNLIWSDEFNDASLNTSNWNYEIGTGNGGWGNNELQYYKEENTSLDQGYLIIEAKKESFSGSQYTSSRLTTENKFDFKYGRVDIRALLPKGQGLWPALWMLGSNFRTIGWPFCGEIDIMEMIGGGAGRDDTVHGTVHWDDGGTKADFGGSRKLSSGIFNDEFHVFSIIWRDTEIKWYLDDVQYHRVDTSPVELSEFQNEFFFIFNVAVGGNWPGSPNGSTSFSQQMIVDYVRVFQYQ